MPTRKLDIIKEMTGLELLETWIQIQSSLTPIYVGVFFCTGSNFEEFDFFPKAMWMGVLKYLESTK